MLQEVRVWWMKEKWNREKNVEGKERGVRQERD
jgi:hypothetical protein